MLFHGQLFLQCLQQSLNDLRICGVHCDVVLVVDGQEFSAHKVILSAASPYFRSMFNTETSFKESLENKITMYDIDCSALASILQFIYTSNIEINEENVYLLMETANLLQIDALRGCINYYLRTTMTNDNCLSLYVTASRHCYHDLAKEAFHYLLVNFCKVVYHDEFLQIPLDVLLEILSSKLLNISDEGVLLQCVLKWIRADLPVRKVHLDKLLSKIELTQVPMQTLIQIKSDPLFNQTHLQNKIGGIINDVLAKKYESGIENFMSAWGGGVSELKKFRYRAEQEVILAIGGESNGMASHSVECFTLGFDSWRYFVPQCIVYGEVTQDTRVIPGMRCARYHAAVTCDSYNAYVIGGRNSTSLLDECETYDIRTNQWQNLRSLPVRVQGGGAVLCEGRLVTVGGRSELGAINQMWEYDEKRKVWKSLPPLNSPRYFHGTVVVGGHIFVMGGYDSNEKVTALKTVERYYPNLNRWFEMPPMREARAKFGCAVIDDCIYVMGGIDENVGLKSVESYNVRTNEWTYMHPMTVPRYSFGVTVSDKRIYCLGGHDTLHYLNSVDKFNPRTDRWHCVHGMQRSRYGLVAATLFVPLINEHGTTQRTWRTTKKGQIENPQGYVWNVDNNLRAK